MISLENYRDKAFVSYCNQELEDYGRTYKGIENALLATADGFELAAYSSGSNVSSADKLAAVGSSLFALGVSLVGEFHLQNCRSIILDSSKGKIYISAVQHDKHSIILMIQTNENATLGNVIHGVKKLQHKVTDKLEQLQPQSQSNL